MSTNDPTNAERQRRHREQVKARLAGLQVQSAPPKGPRKKTRPQRLSAVLTELGSLLDEYTAWRENMPANFQEGEQAQRLDETIDQIQTAIDTLDAIEPPRVGG
jgi:hypothetical protein